MLKYEDLDNISHRAIYKERTGNRKMSINDRYSSMEIKESSSSIFTFSKKEDGEEDGISEFG